MLRLIRVLVPAAIFLTSNVMAANLISEAEAKLPAGKTIATRALTRGPGIKVISPDPSADKIASPFALRIAFEPRGGSKIDVSSLKFTYLKTPNVELLDRVKSGVSENGIELANAEVPVGEHQIRVIVQDSEGRQTSTVLNLNVVK